MPKPPEISVFTHCRRKMPFEKSGRYRMEHIEYMEPNDRYTAGVWVKLHNGSWHRALPSFTSYYDIGRCDIGEAIFDGFWHDGSPHMWGEWVRTIQRRWPHI